MSWCKPFPRRSSARTYCCKKILKNIWVISMTFFFTFVAYSGLASLQSSIHIQEGMGVINLSITYAAMVIACFVTPRLAIRKLGHKWSISLSIVGYILWMIANAYAVWATMVPTSIIVGIAAVPFWTAQCAYFTDMAKLYALLNRETVDAALSKFFGIFFFCFQARGVLSSVILSTVLRPRLVNATEESPPDDDVLALCGVNDCPGNNITSNSNLAKPEDTVLWTLIGIYATTALVGIATLVMFMDPMPDDLDDVIAELKSTEGNDTCTVAESKVNEQQTGSSTKVKKSVKEEVYDLLTATAKQMVRPTQILLVPILIFSGLEQSFDGADFAKSYISCALGIWMVGYVNIPQSVCNAITCIVCGQLVKYTGRIPIMVFGAALQASLLVTCLLWMPHPDELVAFLVISGLWGVCDAIWQTQINAFVGVTFQKNPDAAFATYRVWESCGFIMAFAYSSFLCTAIKLYITMGFLAVGMVGYCVTEALGRKLRKLENGANKEIEKDTKL